MPPASTPRLRNGVLAVFNLFHAWAAGVGKREPGVHSAALYRNALERTVDGAVVILVDVEETRIVD